MLREVRRVPEKGHRNRVSIRQKVNAETAGPSSGSVSVKPEDLMLVKRREIISVTNMTEVGSSTKGGRVHGN